jgi:hypothetical protein
MLRQKLLLRNQQSCAVRATAQQHVAPHTAHVLPATENLNLHVHPHASPFPSLSLAAQFSIMKSSA